MKNKFIWAGIVIAIAIGLFALVGNNQSGIVGAEGDTNFTNVVTSGYVKVGSYLLSNDQVTAYTATTTLTAAQSGSIIEIGTNGGTYTLPAVTATGTKFRFVVGSAYAGDNAVLASAEGDNITGTLIVAGAVVDCRAEDFINSIADGEAVGDFVDVYSDGTQWLIGASGVLTTAKMTCTDPS